MSITNDIINVGVNDREITLFEGQYAVENGMAYNSYVITDEKAAVMDSVGEGFGQEWLDNVAAALDGRAPDYLVVQHMEPDHSASIAVFMEEYPDAVIVSSAKAFAMMKQFFGTDFAGRRLVVAEGSVLSLGRHELRFIAAPMVHWPEVIMTYDSLDKLLFSADGFGKFGTTDADEDWACEARRYYFGIVGKYGAQVQSVLKKAAGLDIGTICPLHGPVLTGDLSRYLSLYDTWSAYRPEDQGVMIAYSSVYGHTEKAALLLKEKLEARGCTVAAADLNRDDMAEAVEDAFRYSALVLASVTYNAGVFPSMRQFLDHLTERNYQNRTVGVIENGTWAPMAGKVIKQTLSGCKNLTFTDASVTIRSALDASSLAQLDALADELWAKEN